MRLDHLLLGRTDKQEKRLIQILSRNGNSEKEFLSYSFLIKQRVLPKKKGAFIFAEKKKGEEMGV